MEYSEDFLKRVEEQIALDIPTSMRRLSPSIRARLMAKGGEEYGEVFVRLAERIVKRNAMERATGRTEEEREQSIRDLADFLFKKPKDKTDANE